MQAKPLSLDLRELSNLMREHARRDSELSPRACRRLSFVLALAARKADDLEARATDAEELEDELMLVAGNLEQVAVPTPISFQATLKAQQAELQRHLDGRPEQVSRPGLAALAMAIGDSNVVTFPRAPRPPLIDCQDDGGDAA